jgi:hypothetical protein
MLRTPLAISCGLALAAATLPATAAAQLVAPTTPAALAAATPPAAPAVRTTPDITGGLAFTPIPAPGLQTVLGRVTLWTQGSALLGGLLQVRGKVPRPDVHGSVLIERLDPATGGWSPATSTHADSNGGFLARWRTSVTGVVTIRALAGPRGSLAQAARATASPTTEVTVYKPGLATIYGPGFYGHQTACGQLLTTATVGVASPTLPCGTLVRFYYNGKLLDLPVIDRGPYANHAQWDLTEAAASELGAPGTVHVGTIVAGSEPVTASLGTPSGSSTTPTSLTGGAVAAPA